ncbi:RNA-directed DNA polymerase [Tanacetum coccineum]
MEELNGRRKRRIEYLQPTLFVEVVDEYIKKIQDLQCYTQHDDNILTLSFGTTNKVGTLKTCEEIIGFNDDEDVKGFRVDVKRKSIKDKVRHKKVFDVDEALDIENPRAMANAFQEDELEYAELLDEEAEQVTYVVQRTLCLPKLPSEPHPSPYRWIEKVSALKEDHGNMMWTLYTKTLVTLVASPKEFQAERKETGVSYALVVKGVEDVMENAIPAVVKPLLAEFGKTVADDTPVTLPPLKNIQHQIYLSRKTTLLVSICNKVLGFDSIKKLYTSDEDFGNRLCIPKTPLRSQLVKEIHAKGLSALGRDKTIASVESRFDWSKLKRDVGAFVKRCVVCQEGKGHGSNLDEFLNVLTMKEADITGPIKEDVSNDLDGQHSTNERKPYHNTLRWQIMRDEIFWKSIILRVLGTKDDIRIVDADATDTTRAASVAKDVAGYVKDATMGSVFDREKMVKDVQWSVSNSEFLDTIMPVQKRKDERIWVCQLFANPTDIDGVLKEMNGE